MARPDLEQVGGLSCIRTVLADRFAHTCDRQLNWPLYCRDLESSYGNPPEFSQPMHDGILCLEPAIGHIKNQHRMGHHYLTGTQDDAINAIFAAAGYNFHFPLNWLRLLLRLPMVLLSASVKPLHA